MLFAVVLFLSIHCFNKCVSHVTKNAPIFPSLFSPPTPTTMATVLKAEEILPDSTRSCESVLRIAFRKPGADTPGRFDDLDYDLGNLEATDNHQVNLEVGFVSARESLIRSCSTKTRRTICSTSQEITHSF